MPTNYIVWQTGLISHFGPYKREERRKRKEGHKKKREIHRVGIVSKKRI